MQRAKYEYYLAGLGFPNPDGSSRYAILRECENGESLVLKREPGNSHDKNAIAVHRQSTFQQLGYLPAFAAKRLSPKLDNGTVEVSKASLEITPERAGARICMECLR